MPMNRAATIFLNQNSKDFNLLNAFPIPETVNASNQANRMMGMPAESEKNRLSRKPMTYQGFGGN